MNARTVSGKITPVEARAQGFIIDSTCYPWIAYKGPRFQPEELRECLTDAEVALISSVKELRKWLWCDLDIATSDDIERAVANADAAISKAREAA